MGIWYLHHKPNFPDNFGETFGFKREYNGLGVFLFKKEGVWMLAAFMNRGMTDVTPKLILETLDTTTNACQISSWDKDEVTIEFLYGRIEIYYKVHDHKLSLSYRVISEEGFEAHQCIKDIDYKEAL
jgi:hypothetical protein